MPHPFVKTEFEKNKYNNWKSFKRINVYLFIKIYYFQ